MRLVFMGTPAFAVPALQELLASEHEIVAVYTAPPKPAKRGQKLQHSPVHEVAEQAGIPVCTPTSLKSPDAQAAFVAWQADAAIVIAYGLLLPQAVLDAPRFGCINVHPSDLPRWRGAAPIQRSIMAGDSTTALCIMQMDAGLDTGDVLWRESFPLPAEMTAGELHNVMAAKAAPALLDVLSGLKQGSITPEPQDAEGATYAAKISKEEAQIDVNRPAAELLHHIHGLSPYPAAYLLYKGERIKWLKAEVIATDNSQPAGTVLDEHFTLQTAYHAIRPLILQREGKKPMPAAECLRGLSVELGELSIFKQ